MMYNTNLSKLCAVLSLGELVAPPVELSGGLLNRMYALETSKGKFAIKALNPQIMLRPEAMQNYVNSELIAQAAASVVPALPAQRFDGSFMNQVDGQYFLVFSWVEGRTLKAGEIQVSHSRRMGEVLGALHHADFSALGITDSGPEGLRPIDWGTYLSLGKEQESAWVEQLEEVLPRLLDWEARSVRAAELLAEERIISHRDMDPKNIIWRNSSPVVIDWEAAGYINPMQELVETAVYWAQVEGRLDRKHFTAFLEGYRIKAGSLQADWTVVLDSGFSGKLGWLEYSLKRSLWLECSDAREQQMGTAEVVSTVQSLRRYADKVPTLARWLGELQT